MCTNHFCSKGPIARILVLSLFGGAIVASMMNNSEIASAEKPEGPVKAHETGLSVSREWFAGSMTALRCDVHSVKSIAETVPLAGAQVDVWLRTKDGKEIPLQTATTDARGVAEPRFQVPLLAAGTYKLVVTTISKFGSEKLEQDVRIKADSKILLVTDKPLYQPGQLIHIRALA